MPIMTVGERFPEFDLIALKGGNLKEANAASPDDYFERVSLDKYEGKWKIVIIVQLFAAKAPLRFSELERRVEGVNKKMLIQQLKELEKDGIVTRKVYPEVPPRVEYALSAMGLALGPAIEALVDWAFLRREAQGEPPAGEQPAA